MRYQRSFRPPDFGLPFVLGRDQQHAVRIFPIQAQHKLGELARLDKIVVAAAILAPFGVLVATTVVVNINQRSELTLLEPSVDGVDELGLFSGLGEQANACDDAHVSRSEEHTSELQSLMRISYAVFCLKKK